MENTGNKIKQKLSKKYYCEDCDYNTDRKSNINNHYNSLKHKKEVSGTKNKQILSNNNYICENCNKIYQTTSGLWKHKKCCSNYNDTQNDNKCQEITSELVIEIVKQNQEFKELIVKQNKENQELQKQMLEVIKNGTNNTNMNNNNNNNNKTFNLQLFLHEECKDALNIAEFVTSIKVQLEDLETTGKLGYVEGVSRIINKNLNELEQTKRPIHCSDVKREVLYIKNEDQWIKENETKPILTKAIRQIANENIKQISEWRKKYPDCIDSDSRNNDQYLNIVSNAMSGSTTEEQLKNYDKIISKVAKEVVIEKET